MATSTGSFLPGSLKAWEPSLRPANPEDAREITNIYEDVYKGTYSYKEYQDKDYISNDISQGNSSWYVIEDQMASNEIVGVISGAIDDINWRVYVRGMMIRPDWQGLGGTTRLFGEVFKDFMKRYKGKVNILWSETRTASLKPQMVGERVGFVPLGILPHKDVFFNERESPVITGIFSSEAWKERETTMNIIPGIVPIHDIIAKMLRPMRKDHLIESQVHPITFSIKSKVGVQISPLNHGYRRYTFSLSSSDDSIQLDANLQCMNAEHLVCMCKDPGKLLLLLRSALKRLSWEGFQYVEGSSGTENPMVQQAFMQAGFTPTGYLPAWDLTRDGRRVDRIVWGWTSHDRVKLQSCFTRKSKRLFEILREAWEKTRQCHPANPIPVPNAIAQL
ncbi:GNAT family N-acetyltransferase [Candidatus Bathyarchaeota archaeon]|nr:GNAT family N-acetyltransferase [Candidatus Bathyarchaeota archaeon]